MSEHITGKKMTKKKTTIEPRQNQTIFRSYDPFVDFDETFMNPDAGLTLREIAMCCIIVGVKQGKKEPKRYVEEASDDLMREFYEVVRSLSVKGVINFEVETDRDDPFKVEITIEDITFNTNEE